MQILLGFQSTKEVWGFCGQGGEVGTQTRSPIHPVDMEELLILLIPPLEC